MSHQNTKGMRRGLTPSGLFSARRTSTMSGAARSRPASGLFSKLTGGLASRLVMAVTVLATLTGGLALVSVVNPAPASAYTPAFKGYVISGERHLGMDVVPGTNGTYGLCIDSGSAAWPGTFLGAQQVDDPRVSYLLARFGSGTPSDLDAAALWILVGSNRTMYSIGGTDYRGYNYNDQNAYQNETVDAFRSERPALYADVMARIKAMDIEARMYAPGADGYKTLAGANAFTADLTGTTGQLSNVGVLSGTASGKSADGTDHTGDRHWLRDLTIGLEITSGNAEFNSTGTATRSVSSDAMLGGNGLDAVNNGTVNIRSTNGQPITDLKVKMTVTGLPQSYFNRMNRNAGTQNVAYLAPANKRVVAYAGDTQIPNAELVPLRFVKSTATGDNAGVVGVSFVVHEDLPTGPIVPAGTTYTLDPSHVQGNQAVLTTGADYDESKDYWVEITVEPSGWVPEGLNYFAQASFDAATGAFTAAMVDYPTTQPTIVTKVSDQDASVGDVLTDTVIVSGIEPYAVTVNWTLHGPIAPNADGTCAGLDWAGAPVRDSGSFTAEVSGEYVTTGTVVEEAACYSYSESIPPYLYWPETVHPPGIVEQTSVVKHDPSAITQVSAHRARKGDTLYDNVTVTGTGGHTVTGEWKLLGPVRPLTDGSCPTEGSPAWNDAPLAAQGTFTAEGDGTVKTGHHVVEQSGCFGYVERLLPGQYTRGTPWSPPGVVTETGITTEQPTLVTKVQRAVVQVGETIIDDVIVTGTQGTTVTGGWRIYGPIPPHKDGSCFDLDWSNAPIAAFGTFTVTGDGTYPVGEYVVTEPSCYTYSENLEPGPATEPHPWTEPGIPAETVTVLSSPDIKTKVRKQRVTAGTTILDYVTVTGTQGVKLQGLWKILGPIAPRIKNNGDPTCRNLDWTNAPVAAKGEFTIDKGDGIYKVGKYRAEVSGCLTYIEKIKESPSSNAHDWTRPGIWAETVTVTPKQPNVPDKPVVSTGYRGQLPGFGWDYRARTTTPATVEILPKGYINGRTQRFKAGKAVSMAATSLGGARFNGNRLAITNSMTNGSIWTDGASLNALTGTTVLAGHVSDYHDRSGRFRALNSARKGQVIITRSGGKAQRWRVTDITTEDRTNLSASWFQQHMKRELVLITCTNKVVSAGGRFHYTKNRIVTAVPVQKTGKQPARSR